MPNDVPRQDLAAFKRDLTELAAAIARIKAKVGASGMPPPDGLPAAERIKEIILALRDLAGRVDAMIALATALEAEAIPATDATPHVPAAPLPRAMPRATLNDSLAALRALSEEELIALFR